MFPAELSNNTILLYFFDVIRRRSHLGDGQSASAPFTHFGAKTGGPIARGTKGPTRVLGYYLEQRKLHIYGVG
eukprot:6150036-Pleurochrysis_carterae.AAC.4